MMGLLAVDALSIGNNISLGTNAVSAILISSVVLSNVCKSCLAILYRLRSFPAHFEFAGTVQMK